MELFRIYEASWPSTCLGPKIRITWQMVLLLKANQICLSNTDYLMTWSKDQLDDELFLLDWCPISQSMLCGKDYSIKAVCSGFNAHILSPASLILWCSCRGGFPSSRYFLLGVKSNLMGRELFSQELIERKLDQKTDKCFKEHDPSFIYQNYLIAIRHWIVIRHRIG